MSANGKVKLFERRPRQDQWQIEAHSARGRAPRGIAAVINFSWIEPWKSC